jgi:predicted dehydrogenase
MSIKIGVIGAGHMGFLHLLSCLKMKNPFVVNGVADKSKNIRKKISEYNVPTYDDYKTMLEEDEFDCVIVSLPNFLKKDSIEYISDYDIDVFIDKPIARNYKETVEIKNVVERSGNQLMVGTNYRYHPNIQKVKDTLETGKAGNIWIGSYELIMNGPFSHPRTPRPIADWYIDPERSGGGAVLDLGYHLLDLNQWFFGKSKLKFSTMDHVLNLPVEDSAIIITESEDGSIKSVFNVGWFSKVIFPEFNFRVNLHGSNGFISSEKYAPRNMYMHAVKQAISNFFRKITFNQINYLSYTYYYSSFYEIIKEFLTSVKNGDDFPVDLEGQLEVMRIIDEVYRRGENYEQDNNS